MECGGQGMRFAAPKPQIGFTVVEPSLGPLLECSRLLGHMGEKGSGRSLREN
jgi:hypothetical protein